MFVEIYFFLKVRRLLVSIVALTLYRQPRNARGKECDFTSLFTA